MNKLLCSQNDENDFKFMFKNVLRKILAITKTEVSLGVTIADDPSSGYTYIKRLREESIFHRINDIKIGDFIEQINGSYLIGVRHFEVAKILKAIPIGTEFTIKLIEPTNGTSCIRYFTNAYNEVNKMQNICVNNAFHKYDAAVKLAINKIDYHLETFMGSYDSELAREIWEIGKSCKNSSEFAKTIDESEIGQFQFSEEFIFDLWGAISDAKAGRLQ